MFSVKENLDNTINSEMELGSILSLSTAIIHKNEVVWAKAYGEQSSLETIHMIASITKSFTATAILQLYEKGLLELDDDVNNFLPFTLRNPHYPNTSITFRMLMSHTSSLGESQEKYWDVTFQDLWKQLGFINDSLKFPPYPNWLKEYLLPSGSLYSSEVWMAIPPSSLAIYSNPAYDVLSLIVQNITNQSFEEYLKENIFSPLEMRSTGFNRSQFSQQDIVTPYFWNSTLNLPSPLPKYDCYAYGAGALRTSVLDLSKFLITNMNGGRYKNNTILENSTLNLMHDCTQSNLGTGYGFGWAKDSINLRWSGHNGGTVGTRTQMLFTYPQHKTDFPVGVIVFGNQGSGSEGAIRNILTLLMEEALNFSIPSEPINIKTEVINGSILVNWEPPNSDVNNPIKIYTIYRGNTNVSVVPLMSVLEKENSYLDTTSVPNTDYYYAISSTNAVGESNLSIIAGPITIKTNNKTTGLDLIMIIMGLLIYIRSKPEHKK